MVALGLALFLVIGLLAFWVLAFLMGFVLPYWLTLGAVEMMRPKRLKEDLDSKA